MASAPIGPTVPEAGVIATSPPTAPVAIPRTLGLPWFNHSTVIQVKPAVAVAMWVTAIAMPATPSAASSLPALNPNHPTQSIEAPTTVSTRLFGGIGVPGWPLRRPMTRHSTRAAIPALTWTTVPPAKSSTPRSPSQPPPHTQWATGA